MSGGRGGEEGGREETTGGGGETMTGGGGIGGGVSPEGTGVADGRVSRGVLAMSMEGGEGKRGGQEWKRRMPWLSDVGN